MVGIAVGVEDGVKVGVVVGATIGLRVGKGFALETETPRFQTNFFPVLTQVNLFPS